MQYLDNIEILVIWIMFGQYLGTILTIFAIYLQYIRTIYRYCFGQYLHILWVIFGHDSDNIWTITG